MVRSAVAQQSSSVMQGSSCIALSISKVSSVVQVPSCRSVLRLVSVKSRQWCRCRRAGLYYAVVGGCVLMLMEQQYIELSVIS